MADDRKTEDLRDGRREYVALDPETLDAAQQRLYAAITTGQRSKNAAFAITNEQGLLQGPYAAMLLSPSLGEPLQSLGSACRFDTSLDLRELEIVILTVGHHRSASFIVFAHELVARQAGMSTDELDSVRSSAHGEREPLTLHQEVALAVLDTGGVGDGLFHHAVRELGAPALMETITTTGYYRLLADLMHAFDIQAPVGAAP